MRKIAIAAFLILALFSSCRSYTISDGRANISIPVEEAKDETRFSKLEEARINEENRIREEAEKAERERIKAEELKAEEERRMAINNYPENLDEIILPHIYRPAKSDLLLNETITTVRAILIPLGEEPITEEIADSIYSSIADTEPDFIALTGSLSNQVIFAEAIGWDAVTIENGTILHKLLLKDATAKEANFLLEEDKAIGITMCNLMPIIPESAEALAELMDDLEKYEELLLPIALDASNGTKEKRLFFLTSATPATSDWSDFTLYSYRFYQNFAISDYLEEEGWTDVYDAVRHNTETDSGITRKNGGIYERMDFIYSKSMIPLNAFTLPASGLTDRIGAFAVVADVIVP